MFLSQEKGRGQEETFEGDEYVYYLDSGDDFTGVCVCSNSSNYIH